MTSSTSEKPVISSDSAESILGEVGTLLRDLTEIQSSLLSVLKQKRDAMATGALDSLNDLQKIEEEIHRRLKACYDRRSAILERGCSQGLEDVHLVGNRRCAGWNVCNILCYGLACFCMWAATYCCSSP